jgi:23S rRNA pseudouridine1911/1915/1917 synthase
LRILSRMPQQSYIVKADESDEELVDFLAHHLQTSKKGARRLLDARVVFVNAKRVWMARHVLRAGDEVEVNAPASTSRVEDAISILYQDDTCIVANKPAGILANGPDSLEDRLRSQTRCATLEAVHRLDRDTSGCLLCAKHQEAKAAIVELFESHRVTKTYHAIVSGQVPADVREITAPIDGKTAVTRLTILSANRIATHLKLSIETGRTHQIRKHMVAIRHPVLGDKVYSTNIQPRPELRRVPRQMLHATSLTFRHPKTDELIRAKAPFPSDYAGCLKMLKLT